MKIRWQFKNLKSLRKPNFIKKVLKALLSEPIPVNER